MSFNNSIAAARTVRCRRISALFVLCAVAGLVLSCFSIPAGHADEQWRSLGSGIEYGLLRITPPPEAGESTIHVVRVDPARARLKLLLSSEYGGISRSAGRWCEDFKLVAAINAGMYRKDMSTNVGYLKNRSHLQNKHWASRYKSALVFDPKRAGLPQAVVVDLDEANAMKQVENYHCVVQNLRLMKGNGVNVWDGSESKWSEAAVGMDGEGRILFLFCQSPFNMKRFNAAVKSSGLGVVRMMHVEGGSTASLSIRTKDISLDLAGSHEEKVRDDGGNNGQWPIPNVIGVKER
ncbi:MAG: phosphodiester glycosidase family protein [Syntrophales bacterium]